MDVTETTSQHSIIWVPTRREYTVPVWQNQMFIQYRKWFVLNFLMNKQMFECLDSKAAVWMFIHLFWYSHFLPPLALYDRKSLIYKWDNINWKHNGYHTGEFYMQDLHHTVGNEPILDLGNFIIQYIAFANIFFLFGTLLKLSVVMIQTRRIANIQQWKWNSNLNDKLAITYSMFICCTFSY